MARYILVFGPPGSDVSRVADDTSKTLGGLPIVKPFDLLLQRQQLEDDVAEYIHRSVDPERLVPICSELLAAEIGILEGGAVVIDPLATFLDPLAAFPEGAAVCAVDASNDAADDDADCQSWFPTTLQAREGAYADRLVQLMARGITVYQSLPDAPPKHAWTATDDPPTAPRRENKDFGDSCIEASAIETADVTQKCLRLCESHITLFPGTHPVHVTRTSLVQSLKRFPYLISKKIDGTRYMMIVAGQRLWFMNRRLDVWKGPCADRLGEFDMSVFDVEALHGTVTIIDAINSCGNCIRSWTLPDRTNTATNLLRVTGQKVGTLNLQAQTYHDVKDLSKVASNSINDNSCDGLVFTPKRTSYRLGRNNNLIKWKPAEKNTVDFSFGEDGKVYCIGGGGDLMCYGNVVDVPKDVRAGDVIECLADFDRELWVFDRVRRDKTNPNAQWIVDNIIQSIKDDITTDELIRTLGGVRK